MLKREISEKLKLWRTQKNKKALCIIGARQIGKTTIIREFAKQEYENFIEINFILDKGAEKIFEDKLDADTIIENRPSSTRNLIAHLALGHSCISSRNTNVFPGSIFCGWI